MHRYAHRPRPVLVRERPIDAYRAPGRVSAETPSTPSDGPPSHSPPSPGPVPPPDPFTDADALEDLGDRIATLAAHIHAATQRMLELVAEFDRRRGWELGGHRSCAHWLAFRTGIALPAAREKVRAARALVDLPETSAAMARGELSFSQVRALTRVADRENESDLLELARGCTTAQIERLVRGWKLGSREDEAALEEHRHASRALSIFPDHDGTYVIKGRLEPEVGALLMKAIEAAGDVLFRETEGAGREPDTGAAAARRRADALALLAERAMAAGLGGGRDGGPDGGDAPVSGTRAERYQVMLHVDAGTLASDDSGDESHAAFSRAHLHDGTRVSAETSRRISCDAARVRVTHGGPEGGEEAEGGDDTEDDHAGPADAAPTEKRSARGPILSVGRRTRTIPPALRRALEARDRGCRFPGCGLPYTDAHHVEHWADGGETSLANCLLLCRHHHRLVHEGGWRVTWYDEGRPTFVDPRGHWHYDGRWEPPSDVDVDGLLEANGASGTSPDAWTASARWKREADIPDDLWLQAVEAVAGGCP